METGADQNGLSLCLLFPVEADTYGPGGCKVVKVVKGLLLLVDWSWVYLKIWFWRAALIW